MKNYTTINSIDNKIRYCKIIMSVALLLILSDYVNAQITYCSSGATQTSDEDIFQVTINGTSTNPLYANANNCTTVAPGGGSILSRYSNFKTLGSLTHIFRGSVVPFIISENECDGQPFWPFGSSIWIDYNQNGSFADPGEQVFVEPNILIGPRNVTGVFTVPATVQFGCTAMRITVAENISGSGLTPCMSYSYGETEDYIICIDSVCQGAPASGVITPHYNNPCDNNGSIILTVNGNNPGYGLSYQWQVGNNSAGPWVNIAGSTLQTYTLQPPAITTYYNCITTCNSSSQSAPATPIFLNPFPPLNIEVDTAYCNGLDSTGLHLYQYSLQVNNATNSNANIVSVTSPDGTIIGVSTLNITPGINFINGNLIIGSSVLSKYGYFSFKIAVTYPPSTDTCYKIVYMVIPNCAANVCDSNLLQNGTFVSGIFPGSLAGVGNIDHWNEANGNPIVVNNAGCDEIGFIKMQGNLITGDGIKQALNPANKIEKGNWYSVTMCLRLDSVISSVPNLKMRVIAFNGTLAPGNHPPPSSSVSIIGFTGLINSTEWTTVELDHWYAYKSFDNIAINIFNNDSILNSVGYIDGVCLHKVTDTCDCDGFERDSLGEIIFPDELLALIDTNESETTTDTVDLFMGRLKDIYGDWNTELDTFYSGTPDLCCKSIGGKIPPEVDAFNPEDSLAALGVTISIDSVKQIIADIEDSIAGNLITNFPNFEDKFSELATIPNIQIDSLCFCDSTTDNTPFDVGSPFQGMDIVFVHGLDDSGITQSVFNYASFYHNTKWPHDKKEFFKDYQSNGYYGEWKQHADTFWHNNIYHYLMGKSYKNRYLTIAWPSTQRLPFSVHAILTQLYEAMSNGQGVELLDPGDIRGKNDFGKNGFVIITHSTAGLIINVTMAVANQTRTNSALRSIFGPAYRISDKAKLHIALHTALSGSNWAPLTIAVVEHPALAGLASIFIENGLSDIPHLIEYSYAARLSVLVDLCPRVSQFYWMYPISLLNLNPVKTLTVAGGDPGNNSPINNLFIKSLLLPGFDDGVLTLESQVGNPIPASLPNVPLSNLYLNPYSLISAPGVYFPTSKLKLVDMGNLRYRATSYFIAQFAEAHSILFAASAGCTPYISTTGMVQPFGVNSFTRNSLLRYTKHYSFLQSSSYHNSGPNGKYKFGNLPYLTTNYAPSFGQRNYEEESVITDNTVYTDNIVSTSFQGLMERTVKGPHKTFKLRIPFCKKCKTYSKTIWLWQRNYDRLHGHNELMECDYIYQYVLKP